MQTHGSLSSKCRWADLLIPLGGRGQRRISFPGYRALAALLATVVLAAGTGSAQAQGPAAVADLKAGPGNGSYRFMSSTPSTLLDLVDNRRPRPSQEIVGHLSLPPGSEPVPAVVLMHGSGGVYPALLNFWPKLLNEAGFAALVVDSFGPRGVQSTAEDQGQVPFAADITDAFAALGLLASHPRIDPQRIAVMGFSRGGITAWRSAAQRVVAGAAPAGLRFAAHVPVYSGGCVGQLSLHVQPGVFGPAPMLFIHGGDDDYTFAADCQGFAGRIAAAGTPSEFLLIPGARHKFDADDPRRLNLRSVQMTKQGCPLEWDIALMAPRDRRSGERLTADRARDLQRELCSGTGATMEGSSSARSTAAKAVVEFFQRVLKP